MLTDHTHTVKPKNSVAAILGECMKGSVHNYKGSWFVAWYNPTTRKTVKIYRYKGEKMYHKRTAQKLLSVMQSDVENGTFYLEKYRSQHSVIQKRTHFEFKSLIYK